MFRAQGQKKALVKLCSMTTEKLITISNMEERQFSMVLVDAPANTLKYREWTDLLC